MKRSRIDEMICSQEGIKSLTRAEIETLQLKKLNQILRLQRERDRYYKELPEELSDLSELRELPFTTEEELREQGHRMVLCSQGEIRKVITDRTSGTTGSPKRMYYTDGDLEHTIGLFMAGLGEFIFPGSVTMVNMPFSGPYGLGELIAEAIRRLGARPLLTGPFLSYGEYRKVLEEEKPDTFVGMPVQLLSIFRMCDRKSLKRALVSGDACPGSVMDACEQILGTKLFPHYGSREMCLGGAITCPAHEGMHLRENHVIAEIIDEVGEPLPPGQWGELVITTIGMEAQPMIRYRTGDFTRILPERCPCGSEVLRLDRLSRAASPRSFAMEQMDDLLFAIPFVVDYQAERKEDCLTLHILAAKTVPADPDSEIRKILADAFPGETITLTVERAKEEDRALYRAKRTL